MEDISYTYGAEANHLFARFNDPIAKKGPVKTGSYPPNGYGLYDMNGNAWEWVSDWFSEDYYKESPDANPTGPSYGTFRVFRVGGWHSGAGCTAVHHRNALPSHWVDMAGGFRCAKDISETALAELKKLDGEMLMDSGKPEVACRRLFKALELLRLVEESSDTFSMTRFDKIVSLEQKLSGSEY